MGRKRRKPQKVLVLASVASMIDQFNLPNIRLMLSMGYEVHTACNFREGNTCDERQIRRLKDRLSALHVAQHQWDCPRNIRSARKCCRAYRQLLQLMKRQHFAWMHCHSPVGGALARLAAHRAGVPVIYTAHGFHFYRGAPLKNWLLYYPAEKLLAHWTDVLLTVNREDYRMAQRRLKAGRVYYVPGVGIDTKRFLDTQDAVRGKLRRQLRIPESAWILLSVGELSRRKNHAAVIDALAQLGRKDVYYLICGQGEQKEALRKQARSLGVAQNVRMAGFRKEVKAFYQAADIFVFPSLQEGMPAALIEAMAAGLPCAVSDIRGNKELIPKQSLRFPPDSAPQLRQILEKLLDDGALRTACGRMNRQKSLEYDWKKVRRRMRRIYER